MFESVLRTDILNPELAKTPKGIKIIVEQEFNHLISRAVPDERTKTPGTAKNIIETLDLIRQVIIDYEDRTHTTKDGKLDIVFEDIDQEIDTEVVSLQFIDRQPGMFGQGSPHENKIKARRPILREVVEDPDNPGYKRAVLGFFYDNVLRMTCWARTNKQANIRALWLENVMEEYTWFFIYSGVNRILYDGWKQPKMIQVNNNKYYGRSIDYFVRTEKIINISQKILEEVCIKVATRSTTF